MKRKQPSQRKRKQAHRKFRPLKRRTTAVKVRAIRKKIARPVAYKKKRPPDHLAVAEESETGSTGARLTKDDWV